MVYIIFLVSEGKVIERLFGCFGIIFRVFLLQTYIRCTNKESAIFYRKKE